MLPIKNLNLFLTDKEKEILLLKNKRRFLFNTLIFIIKGKNLVSIWKCWRSVSFNFFNILPITGEIHVFSRTTCKRCPILIGQ